jgi:Fic family protein
MKNENCNNKNPFITLFTLLGIFSGFVLYIILKQGKPQRQGDLKKEDKGIGKEKVKVKKLNKTNQEVNPSNELKLSERQKKVVAILKKEGKIYPAQLQEILPNVSTRTIRRDMTDLEKKNIVEQKGSTKSTYYIYTK